MAQKSFVPGEVVRRTLILRGVNSVNVATQWAGMNGITPSSVVSIVRGKRERVDWRVADAIASALQAPELWYTEWADWYYEGAEEPSFFRDLVAMFRDCVSASELDEDLESLMQEA